MGGTLEYEIRLLPPVLACSITPNEIVVLVDDSCDQDGLREQLARLTARHLDQRSLRLVRGSDPRSGAAHPRPSRRRRAFFLVVAMATAALIVGIRLGGGSGPAPEQRLPPAPIPNVVTETSGLDPCVGAGYEADPANC